jgi:hypothetical protein
MTPLEFLPQYDELWVVSDIHMGGERSVDRNFQIFKHGARLANFVRRLAVDRPDDTVALVLNGDIIDSLAEDIVPGYVALDVETAFAMMERISTDPSFSPVWDALAEFVRTPKRHLVLVVGNHDIELALGPVQAWIRSPSPSAPAKRRRGSCSRRAAALRCRVGAKRVSALSTATSGRSGTRSTTPSSGAR